MLRNPRNRTRRTTRQGTPTPTPTVPASPPSASLIPQSPTSPGYSAQTPRGVGGVQGPALYGTADQVNTPAYQDKVGEAEGAARAAEQLRQQKELLAAMRAGMGGDGDGLTAMQRQQLKDEKAKKKALTTNANLIRKVLESGSYGTEYDTLLGDLKTAAGTATGTINTGYDTLKNLISGQTNPYAGLQFKAAETNPALAQFLQSQGGDVTALQQRVMAENTAGQQANAQFQNIADILGTRQTSGASQRLADVEAARLAALGDLGSQQTAIGFGLRQKKNEERDKLNAILLQLAGQGIDVGGLYGTSLPSVVPSKKKKK